MTDDEAVVIPDARTPFYDDLTERWPDSRTVRDYESGAHRRALELASQKPVINVTVAGVPGHLSADTGTGEIVYSPEPSPEPTLPLAVPEPPCT